MTIDLITADLTDPATFEAQADLAWSELITIIPQLNTLMTALNFLDTSTTSSDTETISGTATVTFTVESGKSFLAGMTVKCAYTTTPSNWMLGDVLSYSGTSLQVKMRDFNGSGALTGWTISLAPVAPAALSTDEELVLRSNSGVGSTNTAIQRYTTVVKNTLTDSATYTSSATLGDYITIDVSGDYHIRRFGAMSTAANYQGVSLNSAGLSTSFATRMSSNPEEFVLGYYTASQSSQVEASRIVRLSAADVLRAHNMNSGAEGAGTIAPFLTIKKIA